MVEHHQISSDGVLERLVIDEWEVARWVPVSRMQGMWRYDF